MVSQLGGMLVCAGQMLPGNKETCNNGRTGQLTSTTQQYSRCPLPHAAVFHLAPSALAMHQHQSDGSMAGCVAKHHVLILRPDSHNCWLSVNILLQSFQLPLTLPNIQMVFLYLGTRQTIGVCAETGQNAHTPGRLPSTHNTGNVTHIYVEHRTNSTLKQQRQPQDTVCHCTVGNYTLVLHNRGHCALTQQLNRLRTFSILTRL